MSIDVSAEKRAYKKFIAAGMTPAGACGLIGNLEAESDGFIPSKVEYLCIQRLREAGKSYCTQESYNKALDEGRISCEEFLHPLPGRQYGYGLVQWTTPARKSGLWTLAHQKGVSLSDEDMQLEYLLKELQTSYPSVMQVLTTATSIRAASDVVLKRFECPANTGESVCQSRAARGQKFYDENMKEDKSMTVRMSNCGHDERNKYSGGAAGDQTGTEWYLRSWYAYPWDYVIRWKDQSLGNLFADLAVEAAQNNLVGYDQNQRETFWAHLKASNYRPSQITVKCEADCSSGVAALIKAVGYLMGIKDLQNISTSHNTWTLTDFFKSATGKKYFTMQTGKHLTDPSLAVRGEINLNTNHHVNITVDNGANSGATKPADNKVPTTDAITVAFPKLSKGCSGVAVKMLQQMLGVKVDGNFGAETEAALKAFQGNVKLEQTGKCTKSVWRAILNHMIANTYK